MSSPGPAFGLSLRGVGSASEGRPSASVAMNPPDDERGRSGGCRWLQRAERARLRAVEMRRWAEAARAWAALLRRDAAEHRRVFAELREAILARLAPSGAEDQAGARR